MDIEIGSIVRSKAGRDKGMLFLVVDAAGEYAYVADGKLRKREKPKKKKLKHLQGTHCKTQEDFSENFQIRGILAQYLKRV